jgi:hypothetical protein
MEPLHKKSGYNKVCCEACLNGKKEKHCTKTIRSSKSEPKRANGTIATERNTDLGPATPGPVATEFTGPKSGGFMCFHMQNAHKPGGKQPQGTSLKLRVEIFDKAILKTTLIGVSVLNISALDPKVGNGRVYKASLPLLLPTEVGNALDLDLPHARTHSLLPKPTDRRTNRLADRRTDELATGGLSGGG